MARPKPDQRKAAILDAVVGVIIDIGFTEMTIADVAKRAGVSSALVHYHFSSKADLIAEALTRAAEDDKFGRTAAATGEGSALARLDTVLCDSLPVRAGDASWLLWIETWGETRRTPAIRRVMSDLEAHEYRTLVDLIHEGRTAGEFECADPDRAVRQLQALRDGLAIQRTLFNPDHAVDEFIDLLSAAIRSVLTVDSPSQR